MGDILGGGFILALASFVVAVAAAEHGLALRAAGRQPGEDVLGDHRAGGAVRRVHRRPGHRNRPAVRAGQDRASASAAQIVRPAHLLAAAALFMVILAETGRIPVETHTGTNEFGMIEEARVFEHSGPVLRAAAVGLER